MSKSSLIGSARIDLPRDAVEAHDASDENLKTVAVRSADDPFATFSEWANAPDVKAFSSL